jgi:hypothetical protein
MESMNARLLPEPTRRDWTWASVALAFALLAALSALGIVWDVVVEGRYIQLLGLPLSIVVTRWLVIGAWGRTIWGGRDGLRAQAEAASRD